MCTVLYWFHVIYNIGVNLDFDHTLGLNTDYNSRLAFTNPNRHDALSNVSGSAQNPSYVNTVRKPHVDCCPLGMRTKLLGEAENTFI